MPRMTKASQSRRRPRTRVGRHVAADLAAALGAQVERHGEPLCSHVVVQLLQDAPGLAHQRAAYLRAKTGRPHPFCSACSMECSMECAAQEATSSPVTAHEQGHSLPLNADPLLYITVLSPALNEDSANLTWGCCALPKRKCQGRTASKDKMRFMLVVVSTISSNSGMLPPTRPVLPPWHANKNT